MTLWLHNNLTSFPEVVCALNFPEENRLHRDVGWTAVACVGGGNEQVAKHKDTKEGKWPGVLITFGENVTKGGATVFWEGKRKKAIAHRHLRMIASQFGLVPHEGTKWKGERYCVSFFFHNAAAKLFTIA